MGKSNIFIFTIFVFAFFILNSLSTIFSAYAYNMPSLNITDLVYKVDTQELKNGISIKLITVNYDGKIKRHLTRSYSPLTALIDLGYSISNRNKVTSTSSITELYNNTYVLVESYTTTIDEIVYEIPFETITKGSSLCQKMAEPVKEQEGVLGLMIKRVKRIYKGNELIAEEVLDEAIKKEARPEIIIIKGPEDSPSSVPQRGYDCTYWYKYVDNINATAEEKRWLKYIMKGESGCNAEHTRGFYKGLFQWSPCLWYKQFPNDNIFDGTLQIKRTLEKLKAGANPNSMWPAVHRSYVNKYGELSWLR
ncbi:MAG: hypothetical protein AB9915_01205 [Candidatus Dojkabacteria bacterium]